MGNETSIRTNKTSTREIRRILVASCHVFTLVYVINEETDRSEVAVPLLKNDLNSIQEISPEGIMGYGSLKGPNIITGSIPNNIILLKSVTE